MPKKPKTPAGQPVIKVNQRRLQIVITYRGVRRYHSLGLPDSKGNRIYAERMERWIASDLINNSFDPTFEKYKRDALKPDSEIQPNDDISIAQSWEEYIDYKRPQLASSTIAKDFDRVSKHIEKFPTTSLNGAVAVRNYLNSTTTPNATERALTQLNACCDWALNSKLIADNSFIIKLKLDE
jgi:integrase